MKTIEAADRRNIPRVVLSGGVAANSVLRDEMQAAADEQGIALHITPVELCTDNAAMLGPIAEHYLDEAGDTDFQGHRIRARSNVELAEISA